MIRITPEEIRGAMRELKFVGWMFYIPVGDRLYGECGSLGDYRYGWDQEGAWKYYDPDPRRQYDELVERILKDLKKGREHASYQTGDSLVANIFYLLGSLNMRG